MKSLIAVLGPTATGKSALGIAIAERFNGEIINCDSTAVYRGFDIGTDKVPFDQRRGIPHHLIDIADPTDEYTAAHFARDAAAVIADIHARGKLPIVVGGTGFYYRALTRGLFPGPGKDAELRARLERVARRKGVETLHRMLTRVDAESGARIQSRDLKRIVRALEVYFQTGKPLTAHFDDTVSPLPPDVRIGAVALRMPAPWLAGRLARRVDEQFDAGLLAEIRALLAAGVPPTARPFGGLVYRQAMEHLRGVCDEASTRALIAQENRKYARRQLIWFRKEPNLVWFDGPGTNAEVQDSVIRELAARDLLRTEDMSPIPEAKTGAPNIQDVFLNYARREKLPVTVHLLDGREFEARIKNFDRFALIVEHAGMDHLIFKHAIATIRTPRSVPNYFSSHHP